MSGEPKPNCPSQDEEKAEDEMAKRRAAFLLKQQRKAEESRLRKQQLEAESELKRDEARYVRRREPHGMRAKIRGVFGIGNSFVLFLKT